VDARVKPGHDGECTPKSAAALFHRHGDMQIPVRKALAEGPAFGHIYVRSSIPGGRCSQGGVKIPTGGKGDVAQARERLLHREFLSEVLLKKGQQIRCDSEADG
jgi:hypothetical protein